MPRSIPKNAAKVTIFHRRLYKNGFILSPLYDRLFDQGLVTFDSDKSVRVSPWLPVEDQLRCKVTTGMIIPELPLDPDREKYLRYHRENVFKGV